MMLLQIRVCYSIAAAQKGSSKNITRSSYQHPLFLRPRFLHQRNYFFRVVVQQARQRIRPVRARTTALVSRRTLHGARLTQRLAQLESGARMSTRTPLLRFARRHTSIAAQSRRSASDRARRTRTRCVGARVWLLAFLGCTLPGRWRFPRRQSHDRRGGRSLRTQCDTAECRRHA